MDATSTPRLVFVHSSDELYGADRMLLEMASAAFGNADIEVWLPTDLKHPADPLCVQLENRGILVRHVALPILRRAYRTPRTLVALLGRCVSLARELRRAKPDLVYCTTSAAFLGAPIARLVRVPRVVGHVQEIWTSGDRKVLGAPATACHRLLAISQPVADALPKGLRRKVTVVPNGTPDPGRFQTLHGRTGPLRFLVASRWNSWKGHETLLAAWDRAAVNGVLVILGGPPPSGASVDVPALVTGLRDSSSVTIVGEVTDTSPYIDDADIVVVPSDQPEPFGLVAIEAFARGRPVIASAGGGLMDIVADRSDGWLFPPGDSDALANILTQLDRHQVVSAGDRARQSYEDRYTSSTFQKTWRAVVLPAVSPDIS